MVRSFSEPNAKFALQKETISSGRFYTGVRFSLLLFEVTPEIERVGGHTSYNLRVGFGI